MNLIEKIDAVQRSIAEYPNRMGKIKNPGDLTGSLRRKLNSDDVKFEMKVFQQELRAASVPLRLALASYIQIKKDIVSDIEEIDNLTVQANGYYPVTYTISGSTVTAVVDNTPQYDEDEHLISLITPPTTATVLFLKNGPSHVAHAETPKPRYSSSAFKPSQSACAPVAITTVSAMYVFFPLFNVNGRLEKSTLVR